MALEFSEVTFLKIYTAEDVYYKDMPLYKAIIKQAKKNGLAGITVVKGIEGYATQSRGSDRFMSYFVSGNADLPLILEIVDEKQKIAKILPWLDKNAKDTLVTLRDTTILVTDYIRARQAQLELAQQKQNQPQLQSQQQQQ